MIIVKAPQAELLGAIQRVLGIVERRHALPILANLLLRKTGASIEFTTSDLELQLRTVATLGGDAAAFATTVNARKLAEILRAMPPDQAVTLSADKDKLSLQGGKSRFTLMTLPAEAFPLVAQAEDHGPTFEVPQAALKSLLDQVAFAMAVQDIRYFLNGVLFIAEGARLTLVATDGNRLALAHATLESELPRREVILPRKTVLELQRLLHDGGAGDEPVQVRFGAAQASFVFNDVEFISKLVEGRFPDYRRVIPSGNLHTLTLARASLMAALQRAAILTSEKFRGVRLSLAPGALRIASSNAQQEEANEEIDVDYGGESIEIGFNVGYLVDVLGNTNADTVTLALNDAHSSVLFTFAERAEFQCVVSPMRL